MIQVIVRWAVPCFIMMSGTLLLDPERKIDTNKVNRYIIRMLIVLVTFGFVFCIIETYVGDRSRSVSHLILTSLVNLLEGKSWSHMWYIWLLDCIFSRLGCDAL